MATNTVSAAFKIMTTRASRGQLRDLIRVFQLSSQFIKRLLTTLILSILLSPCLAYETFLAAERQDLAKISVEELIELLEVAETDEKIVVLDELRGRCKDASAAMPTVVQTGVEIMAASPTDFSDSVANSNWGETSAPLFPALWTIWSIAEGNPAAPGVSQAVEFLVDMLLNRGGPISRRSY